MYKKKDFADYYPEIFSNSSSAGDTEGTDDRETAGADIDIERYTAFFQLMMFMIDDDITKFEDLQNQNISAFMHIASYKKQKIRRMNFLQQTK